MGSRRGNILESCLTHWWNDAKSCCHRNTGGSPTVLPRLLVTRPHIVRTSGSLSMLTSIQLIQRTSVLLEQLQATRLRMRHLSSYGGHFPDGKWSMTMIFAPKNLFFFHGHFPGHFPLITRLCCCQKSHAPEPSGSVPQSWAAQWLDWTEKQVPVIAFVPARTMLTNHSPSGYQVEWPQIITLPLLPGHPWHHALCGSKNISVFHIAYYLHRLYVDYI